MIEKKQPAGTKQKQDRAWLVYAIGAAVFAALTSVLAKIGIEAVESNLATAIRTVCGTPVIGRAIVAAKGKLGQLIYRPQRTLHSFAASGIATGASWLLYYYAIAAGQVSVVVQIDKLSIFVSVLFARLAFNEKLSRAASLGLVLIILGTATLSIWKQRRCRVRPRPTNLLQNDIPQRGQHRSTMKAFQGLGPLRSSKGMSFLVIVL